MSPHQPQPVTPFTGSPFDLDGRKSLVSSSAIEIGSFEGGLCARKAIEAASCISTPTTLVRVGAPMDLGFAGPAGLAEWLSPDRRLDQVLTPARAPANEVRMNRFTAILFMTLAVAACGNHGSGAPAATVTSPTAPTPFPKGASPAPSEWPSLAIDSDLDALDIR
jgi:hypothetical protein